MSMRDVLNDCVSVYTLQSQCVLRPSKMSCASVDGGTDGRKRGKKKKREREREYK